MTDTPVIAGTPVPSGAPVLSPPQGLRVRTDVPVPDPTVATPGYAMGPMMGGYASGSGAMPMGGMMGYSGYPQADAGSYNYGMGGMGMGSMGMGSCPMMGSGMMGTGMMGYGYNGTGYDSDDLLSSGSSWGGGMGYGMMGGGWGGMNANPVFPWFGLLAGILCLILIIVWIIVGLQLALYLRTITPKN